MSSRQSPRPSSSLGTKVRSALSWTRWRRKATERRLTRTRAKLERLALRESRLALSLVLAGLTQEAQVLATQQLLEELRHPLLEPPPQDLVTPQMLPLVEQELRREPPAPHFPPPMPPEPEPPPAEDQLRDLLQQS